MFSSMILYLCFIAAGVLVGAKVLRPDKKYRWIGSLQMAALLILIFTMGAKIGADERVLASIGTLGAKALIITVCSIAGSVAAVFVVRKLMRLDRRGVRVSQMGNDEKYIANKLCDSETRLSEELADGAAAGRFDTEKETAGGEETICGGELR